MTRLRFNCYEEFSRSLRAWTHGYDFYTPVASVVFHPYNRKSKPKMFWVVLIRVTGSFPGVIFWVVEFQRARRCAKLPSSGHFVCQAFRDEELWLALFRRRFGLSPFMWLNAM